MTSTKYIVFGIVLNVLGSLTVLQFSCSCYSVSRSWVLSWKLKSWFWFSWYTFFFPELKISDRRGCSKFHSHCHCNLMQHLDWHTYELLFFVVVLVPVLPAHTTTSTTTTTTRHSPSQSSPFFSLQCNKYWNFASTTSGIQGKSETFSFVFLYTWHWIFYAYTMSSVPARCCF